MPPYLRDITVDALYVTTSALLIVTVPFELWCVLPYDPAYQFIGHVTSRVYRHDEVPDADTEGPQQAITSEGSREGEEKRRRGGRKRPRQK
jgi:hypothetical protein